MRASGWIIGLLTAVFVVSGLGMFFNSLNSEYGMEGFSEEQYEALDKMDDLTTQTKDVQTGVTNITEDKSSWDVVGGFLSSSFQSLKLVFTSVDTFNEMAEAGADGTSGLGEGVTLFKGYIILVISILIFVGIILSAIIKWKL